MKTYLIAAILLLTVQAGTDAPSCNVNSDCSGNNMCCGKATPQLACNGRICYGKEQNVCLPNTSTKYLDSSDFSYNFVC